MKPLTLLLLLQRRQGQVSSQRQQPAAAQCGDGSAFGSSLAGPQQQPTISCQGCIPALVPQTTVHRAASAAAPVVRAAVASTHSGRWASQQSDVLFLNAPACYWAAPERRCWGEALVMTPKGMEWFLHCTFCHKPAGHPVHSLDTTHIAYTHPPSSWQHQPANPSFSAQSTTCKGPIGTERLATK